jgi:phosphoribosylaminoimidazolecarboxamide formyltransferase / IMP cyclohydrolase
LELPESSSRRIVLHEPSFRKIRRAIVSVSDKTGIVEFARALTRHSIEILSTGGTSGLLRESGIAVTDVSDVTGFPELLDGRLKTLHPKIHGGILGVRENQKHIRQMSEHAIEPIDLVVVNLYPFERTVAKPGVERSEAIENIDIGGPAMIRSAAKNHADVGVVVDPADYERIAKELDELDGALSLKTRFDLARKAFGYTASYDRAIAKYLGSETTAGDLPEQFELHLKRVQPLRYGENPHQRAALYRLADMVESGVADAEKLQGKELSYNNLLDSDATWDLLCDLKEVVGGGVTCVIIKHTNPCGVGVGESALEAFTRAKSTDPISAFGGIIGFTQIVDREAALAVAEMFAEVVIAPEFSAEALEVFASKKALRILRMPAVEQRARFDFRRISGGVLVQDHDVALFERKNVQLVSAREPGDGERQALEFAWIICKHVKSNAIVYARRGQLLGVGAGQMSRVDSVKLGALKAQSAELSLEGSVLASDAFFPFRDGIDEAAKYLVKAVIQPGGSVRDKEVIEAANEHGIAMLFTGMRHFRH